MVGFVIACKGVAARLVALGAVVQLALFLAAACLASPPSASAQALRKSIADLGPAEIMALRRGVAAMMSRNTAPRGGARFRRSWVYWANMHAHFGASCRGPVTGAGMAGVTAWTASNGNETATWCKCEHGSDQFLTWHRMYIYYFERVLQQAAQDPNLRLPFWDYATNPELPAAFREATYVNETGQTVPNPLRVAARRPQLNDGSAGVAPGAASSSNAMSATTYSVFRTRLESTPHGAVHCAIGSAGCPTGLMGSVSTAALDPIFYLHHANIDRLYECWLDVDQAARLPSGAQLLDRTYSFVDADGSVKTRRVGDMLTTAALGYDYPAGGGCPAPAVASLEMAEMGPTELLRGVTTVPLSVETEGAAARGAPAPGAGAASAPGRATVVVAGLTAAKVPGVIYDVYLANDRGARVQIGVIDFFGFGDVAPGHAEHSRDRDAGRRFEFDATVAVERLGLDPAARPTLIFEPTTGLSDSTPEAAAAAIAPDAGVRFRRAWMRLDR